jgi:sugar/nucleoside kinase (ribokinase family)
VTWEVAVAGTMHRDDITTPHGRAMSYGGSAVYFALAASRYAPVHLNGITGKDAASAFRQLFAGLRVDLSGMVVGEGPTFVWHAVHDFTAWVTANESAEIGCDDEWTGTLSAASRDAEVLFLASLDPAKQRTALDQSAARLIGADSMTIFMARSPTAVRDVALRSDLLFLNSAELAALTGENDWRRAASSLFGKGRLRTVVVTRGPDGAACVTQAGIVEEPAYAGAPVIDPTGAGDALAGGFLGFCARAGRDDDAVFTDALKEGVRCAADAIASFGVDALRAGTSC